jgi:hypothetical protein
MKNRAFSLMEIAVTIAIAGLIGLAATSMFSTLMNSFVQIERETVLSDRIMSVGQFLSTEIASIGGNGTTSNNAIFVDQGCGGKGDYPACPNGSDRVRIFSALSAAPSCRIFDVRRDRTDLIVSLWQQNRRGTFNCCLNDENNDTRRSTGAKQFLRRHALLESNEFHKPVLLTASPGDRLPLPGLIVRPPPPPGPPTDDSACTYRLVDVVEASERNEPSAVDEWRDGSIALADYRTIFIDQNNQLVLHVDRDENGAGLLPTTENFGTPGGVYGWADPAPASDRPEIFVIANDVYDLQVRLGYDDVDTDGNESPLWTPPGVPAPRHVLRMISVDYVMGMKSRVKANTVVTPARTEVGLPGLVVPNTLLRGARVKVSPRNLDDREAL